MFNKGKVVLFRNLFDLSAVIGVLDNSNGFTYKYIKLTPLFSLGRPFSSN